MWSDLGRSVLKGRPAGSNTPGELPGKGRHRTQDGLDVILEKDRAVEDAEAVVLSDDVHRDELGEHVLGDVLTRLRRTGDAGDDLEHVAVERAGDPGEGGTE